MDAQCVLVDRRSTHLTLDWHRAGGTPWYWRRIAVGVPLATRISVPYAGHLRIGKRRDAVPERVCTSDKAGSLEALDETPFAREDELQTRYINQLII